MPSSSRYDPKPMKIVHVVESLDIGGLEHVVLALARIQRQRGHDVEIICLWRLGSLSGAAAAAGLAISCCNKRPGLDAMAIRRMRKMLRAARADVLHTHNPMAHYYAVAACLGLGVSCVLSTRHGMGSNDLSARRERLYRMALWITDFAVSVCDAARQRFVAHDIIPAAKAAVVRNGIELRRFTLRDDEAAARVHNALALPPNAIVFGTVGRLNEAKQHGILLQALRRVIDGGTPASLLIAGDGELRAALEQERDRLGLTGDVRILGARSDVPELLAAMDVFVLPSRTEGYSLALVEASAAGLPIIATDVGGNAEIVKHDVSGLIVPSGDVELLAAAMQKLANDPAHRSTLGHQGRAWALREGSLDAMYDGYLRLYAQRVAGPVQAEQDSLGLPDGSKRRN